MMAGARTYRPDPDLDLSNLTRRQAAVFEQLCIDAAHGHCARLNALDYEASLPLVSPERAREIVADRRDELALLRAVQRLTTRLRRLRTRVLTKLEAAQLAVARAAEPDLPGRDADLVIYDMRRAA